MPSEPMKDAEIRVEVLREAMTMTLYLSIVLLATFVALPTGSEDSHGEATAGGIHGLRLVGLIWGTAIGLALAHWFAFRVTASAFGKGTVTDKDVKIGLAQLAAAAGVAAVCTIPVLVFDRTNDVMAATYAPALIVGFAGYAVARQAERSRIRAVIVGLVVLALGLAVAAIKNFLLGH